ncbi:MAG: TatD family hydrolase [Patescibacteria group bacterium]|nr:TatD family hydrolase [Patescibacteria group bacterium]
MRLVDIHAHLDYPPLNEISKELIERSVNAGVKYIISNGTNPESNRKVLELAKKYSIVKPALGFYPTHVQEVSEEELDSELDFISKQKNCVAIGEVGLDKAFAPEDKQEKISDDLKEELFSKQKAGFKKIINLAEKTGLPLIVHSRKAELEVIEMLEESKVKKIIMHCFMGKKKYVERIRNNGWTFSIPVIVIKLQQMQELVRDTPMKQLLTETDSPFLGPIPGESNEPKNVSLSIKKIAEIKGLTENETADSIFMNYQNLFL